MFFVYALKSISRQYIYVGLTNNFERRLHEHNSGQNRTTRAYMPFEKLIVKTFPSRAEARKHEKFLKSGTGKEQLRAIINLSGVVNLPAGRQDW